MLIAHAATPARTLVPPAPGTARHRGPERLAPRPRGPGTQGPLRRHGPLRLAVLCALLASAPSFAEPRTVRGQLLYVPVYSEIAYGDRRHTLNLSATVTIRNTDRRHPIKLTRVDYFNTAGNLIRSYGAEPRPLAPMASSDYLVSGADRSGGTAASFLIAWESAEAVSPPRVEAVMIGAAATNGISFSSSAQVLEERP